VLSPKASQDVVKTVQLGAALAELLLSCAKVEVPAEQADLTLRWLEIWSQWKNKKPQRCQY